VGEERERGWEGVRRRESDSLLGQEGDRGSSWNDGLQVLPPTCECSKTVLQIQ